MDQFDEVLRGERLVPEHQQHVVQPGLVQGLEGRVVERFQVDALDLGAERGGGRDDLELRGLGTISC